MVGLPSVAAALLVLLVAARADAIPAHDVYEQACASCHGADGRGAPTGTAIAVPLPDFTDCVFATAESTANWVGLVRDGGRFLGMSPQMPAFGDVLSEAEIRAVVAYVRGFCPERGYPIGDLNYRRPVFVELEDHLLANGEEFVAASVEPHDVGLETMAQSGLGDATVALQVVDEAEELDEQVVVDGVHVGRDQSAE